MKLSVREKKRLAGAFVAQALALGLDADAPLPRDVKKRVRGQALHSIRTERAASAAKKSRRQLHEAAENTFVWSVARLR